MQKDKLPIKLEINNEICEKLFKKDKKKIDKLVIVVSNALSKNKSDQRNVKCYAENMDILFEKIKIECFRLVLFNKNYNSEKVRKDLSIYKKNLVSCKKKLKNKNRMLSIGII